MLACSCARQGFNLTAIHGDEHWLVASKGREAHRLIEERSMAVFREKVQAVKELWREEKCRSSSRSSSKSRPK